MELQGKIVVIAGGGAGIGRAGALALSTAGCTVVIGDIDEAAAQATVDEIEQAGGRALAVRCDVTDDGQLRGLAERATGAFGPVDVLWNHAGSSLAGPPERIPLERWRSLIDLNVLGGIRGLLAFLPAMLERGSGHVIFTTSGLGLFPDDIPGLAAPYVVTKAAQIALARTLAPYLAARGVGVCLLAPDITNTRHTFEVPTVDLDPALVSASLDLAALQQPDQVAQLLVDGLRADTFLISAVPRTRERLVQAAQRLYAQGTEAAGPLVQYVRIEADPDKHNALAAVLSEAADTVAKEPGSAAYQVSADLHRPGVFHMFEEWDSAADFERHAVNPASQALMARMGEFGIGGLHVRRFGVSSIDDAPVDAAS